MIDKYFSIPENPVLDLVFKAINEKAVISISDKNGIITNVNEQFCQLSGYTKEELIGKTHNIINSGYHDKAFWQNLWLTISAGKPWKGVIRNKTKNGSFYWVDSTIYPVIDALGSVTSYVSLRYDITETKEKELNAAKIEYNLQSMLNSISDGNLLISWDYEVLFLNKIVQLYFNQIYNTPLNIGDNILDFLNGKIRDEFIKSFSEAQKGNYVSFEREINLSRDYNIWAMFQFTSIYNQDGKPVGIAINIINIDEQKKNYKLLQEKENLNKLIIENAKTGILLIDSSGFTISANPEACEILAMSEVELKTINLRDFLAEDEETYKKFLAERKKSNYYHGSLHFKRKDGQILLCVVNSTQFIDDGKDIATFLFRDITKEKNLELELQQKQLNLEALINNTDDFIVSVDREFKIIEFNNVIFNHIKINEGRELKKGDSVFLGLEPELHEMYKSIYYRVLKGENVYDLEKIQYKHDANISYYESNYHPIIDNNEIIGIAIFSKNVTSRIEQEEKLKQLTTLLESTNNAAKIGSWDYKVSTNNLFWTDQLFKILEEDKNVNVSLLDLMSKRTHPEDKEKRENIIYQALINGEAYSHEYRINTKSGIKYLLSIGTPYKDQNGNVIGIKGTAQDITDRKLIEEELKKSKIELNNLFNSTTDSIIFVGKDYKIISFNKEANLRTIALRNSPLYIGENILDALLDENFKITEQYKTIKEKYDKALNNIPTQLERKITLSNGEELYRQIKYLPVKNESNEVIGVSFNSTDITEKKKAEIKLLESQLELKAIFNSSNESHFFVAPDYTINSFNKTAHEAIYSAFKEYPKKGESILLYNTPNEIENFKFNFKKALRGNLVKVEKEIELEMSNTKLWIETTYTPVKNEKFQIIGVSYNINDISERKKQEVELKQLKNLLESTNEVAKIGNYDYNIISQKAYWTKELYRIFEINESVEKLHEEFIDKIHPDDLNSVFKQLEYAIIKGIEFNFEFRIITDKKKS